MSAREAPSEDGVFRAVKFEEFNATARARTWDNHVNSVVLYQLSYGGPLHSSVVGWF